MLFCTPACFAALCALLDAANSTVPSELWPRASRAVGLHSVQSLAREDVFVALAAIIPGITAPALQQQRQASAVSSVTRITHNLELLCVGNCQSFLH